MRNCITQQASSRNNIVLEQIYIVDDDVDVGDDDGDEMKVTRSFSAGVPGCFPGDL